MNFENAPKTIAEHAEALGTNEREIAEALSQKPEHRAEIDPSVIEQQAEHAAEKARDTIEAATVAEEDPLAKLQAAEAAAADQAPMAMDLKLSFHQVIGRIQRQESAPARAFSKVIHQRAVRVVSNAAGKTVSRPSGLLGGGVLALLGTSLYLYFAKHYGFEYNYFVFLALFAAGFGVGLLAELFSWATVGRRKHQIS
ncbi:MAG: hypothetical protein JWN38_49 [Candidatus Saccharibacteria bacterium]|nr:hypothetical protein [Candidatus Saccharibacteria bacterium]